MADPEHEEQENMLHAQAFPTIKDPFAYSPWDTLIPFTPACQDVCRKSGWFANPWGFPRTDDTLQNRVDSFHVSTLRRTQNFQWNCSTFWWESEQWR
jgi:hypothetical protein